MRTILVTGGAGFVGSHACKALRAAGYLPVTYDNLSRGDRAAVKWGPLEVGELTDEARLAAVLAACRPLAVMHFAALAYVGESVTDPGPYYANNVGGSLALIRAATAAGVRAVVFSSTCATYGTAARLPLTEQAPQQPINPYGWSKWMVERILWDFDAAHGLRSVMLRYFNAAGGDPDGQIGENHTPETHLVPLVLDAALGRGPAVTVFGTDYPTPDGTCIRDYVHVADLADAHVRALQYLLSGGASVALNLGTGTGYSVAEVIAAAHRVTGQTVPVTYGPRRPGDPPALVAAPGKAAAVLGWRPRRSDLETLIADAWRWRKTATRDDDRQPGMAAIVPVLHAAPEQDARL